MIRAMLIDDEVHSLDALQILLTEYCPQVQVVAMCRDGSDAISMIYELEPQLLFLDIEMPNMTGFELLSRIKGQELDVIFTTAYDAYALKAFKVNSIDYILKPVDRNDLEVALKKLHTLRNRNNNGGDLLASIGEAVQMLTRQYKSRFVIRVGEHLKSIEVNDIHYFYSLDKTTFARAADKRQHIIDFSLEQLEDILDPRQFFRVNRKYIICAAAIQDMVSYTNSRLKLNLKGSDDTDIIVSRERVQEFKDWLDR